MIAFYLMDVYLRVANDVPQPVGRGRAIAYLNEVLPPIWVANYPSTGGEILTVTLGGQPGENGAVSTMFDLQPKRSKNDDRVVAVWGLSKTEPASTRTQIVWRDSSVARGQRFIRRGIAGTSMRTQWAAEPTSICFLSLHQ